MMRDQINKTPKLLILTKEWKAKVYQNKKILGFVV